MYNSQEIAERIKSTAKEKGYSISSLLTACELGKNTIFKMGQGTDILTLNFAKIADYLDVSVDYLLGRQVTESSVPENIQQLLSVASRLSCDQLKNLLQYAEFIESKNK